LAKECRVDADDKPQPQAGPEYDQMDMEHQVEDDVEIEEDVGDVEAEEDVDVGDSQQQRRWKCVPEAQPLDHYPGGPHNTTLLTRYHVHVAKKAAEGEVPINVIL